MILFGDREKRRSQGEEGWGGETYAGGHNVPRCEERTPTTHPPKMVSPKYGNDPLRRGHLQTLVSSLTTSAKSKFGLCASYPAYIYLY